MRQAAIAPENGTGGHRPEANSKMISEPGIGQMHLSTESSLVVFGRLVHGKSVSWPALNLVRTRHQARQCHQAPAWQQPPIPAWQAAP